jgi:hypothetical protein
MRALSDAVEHEDFNRLDDMLKDTPGGSVPGVR